MPNYGDSKYWDERYTTQKNTTFDWLEGWEDLKEIIEKYCIVGLYVPKKSGEEAIQEQSTSSKKSTFLSM